LLSHVIDLKRLDMEISDAKVYSLIGWGTSLLSQGLYFHAPFFFSLKLVYWYNKTPFPCWWIVAVVHLLWREKTRGWGWHLEPWIVSNFNGKCWTWNLISHDKCSKMLPWQVYGISKKRDPPAHLFWWKEVYLCIHLTWAWYWF